MQGWHYDKGLIYYAYNLNQPFAVVPALHSVWFYFTGTLSDDWLQQLLD